MRFTKRSYGWPEEGDVSEAYGGYHFDKMNGINVEAGIFMSRLHSTRDASTAAA